MSQYLPNYRKYKVTTQPAVEPVTLAEVKNWLRIDDTTDDALLTRMIISARQRVEHYIRRALITQSIEYTLDMIPRLRGNSWLDNVDGVIQVSQSELSNGSTEYIDLPFGDLQSITSFEYYDQDDTLNTFSSTSYYADTNSDRVILKFGEIWPVNLRDQNAIIIKYVSGFGDAASDVPAAIKDAIQEMVAKMYETRTASCEITCGCKGLLDIYRKADRRSSRG